MEKFLKKSEWKFLVLSVVKIGKNSVIRARVFILNSNNLIIKENSSIGSDSKNLIMENLLLEIKYEIIFV